MRLSFARAIPEDVDQIVRLAFKTFGSSDMMEVFFGPDAPVGLAHTKRHFLDMFQDSADVLLKIEDLDSEVDVDIIDVTTGHISGTMRQKQILCVADWKVYPRYVPEAPMYGKLIADGGRAIKGEDLKYLKTESKREDAASVLNAYMERRRREQAEPHLHLYLLFTSREFQGRGLGSMMMGWGNKLADSLMVACWVEASDAGKQLYTNSGYAAGKKNKIMNSSYTTDWLPMRRPVRVATQNPEAILRTE